MNKIISWMIEVETKAASLYEDAARYFSSDKNFSNFLSKLAEEEQDHIKMLEESMAFLLKEGIVKASFDFDEDFRHKIMTPIVRAKLSLKKGELTQKEMVDVIAEIEFSEWNEVFIYALDLTRNLDRAFQKAEDEINQHRSRIQDYISELPEGESLLQRVRRLKSAPHKKVLIVEGNSAVARMLEVLTMDDADVFLARDGEEGISHILETRFDLIVADVMLPKMNGIEMYKKALEVDPRLEEHFIFFTGTEDTEALQFLHSSNAIILPKPSPVKLICQVIDQALKQTDPRKSSSLH